MEQLTTFVSSRGLLKSCDAHNRQPVSSVPGLDPDLLARHQPGDAIYVCTDALGTFAAHFLGTISQPFVLVTGDSDTPVDNRLLADPAIAAILASPHLIRWHAQNLAASHPRLEALPIGLDYHTMWEKPGFWGLTAVSPIAQEKSLLDILAGSPQFHQRYLTGYCNWHFAIHRGDRAECQAKADKSVCYYEAHPIPRNSTWMRQAECMFVISPEGAGMDCHRTWEAIVLGCIPIVSRNALAPLFAELPIMIVDDWAEVTRDNLLRFANIVQGTKYDFSPLFRDYWVRRIRGQQPSGLPPMTCAEFRTYLTRITG